MVAIKVYYQLNVFPANYPDDHCKLSFSYKHSLKKRKDSLETWAEPAFLRNYVDNEVILELIPFYRASKCNNPKSRAVKSHKFIILCDHCQTFSIFCQDANKTGSHCAIIFWILSKKHKLALHKLKSGHLKFSYNILLEDNCTKAWGQTSKYYRAGQLVSGCVVWRQVYMTSRSFNFP